MKTVTFEIENLCWSDDEDENEIIHQNSNCYKVEVETPIHKINGIILKVKYEKNFIKRLFYKIKKIINSFN